MFKELINTKPLLTGTTYFHDSADKCEISAFYAFDTFFYFPFLHISTFWKIISSILIQLGTVFMKKLIICAVLDKRPKNSVLYHKKRLTSEVMQEIQNTVLTCWYILTSYNIPTFGNESFV